MFNTPPSSTGLVRLTAALVAMAAALAAPRHARATDNHEHLAAMFTLDEIQTQLRASGLGRWEDLSLTKLVTVSEEFIAAALDDDRVQDELNIQLAELEERQSRRTLLVQRLRAAHFTVSTARDDVNTQDLIAVAGDETTYADVALEALRFGSRANLRIGTHLATRQLERGVGAADDRNLAHVVRYQVGETLRTTLLQDALERLRTAEQRQQFIVGLLTAFVARQRNTTSAGITIVSPQSLLTPDVIAAIATVIERERVPIHILVSIPRSKLLKLQQRDVDTIADITRWVDGVDITGSIQEMGRWPDTSEADTYARNLTWMSDAVDKAAGKGRWFLRIHAFEAANTGSFYRGLETFLSENRSGPASIVIGHSNALCSTRRSGDLASSTSVVEALLAWRSAKDGRHIGFDVNLSSRFLSRSPKRGERLFTNEPDWLRGLRTNVGSLNAVGIPVMAGYDGAGLLDEAARGSLEDFAMSLSEGQTDAPPYFRRAFRCDVAQPALNGKSPATYSARAFYADVYGAIPKRLPEVNRVAHQLRQLTSELDATHRAQLDVLGQEKRELTLRYNEQCETIGTVNAECTTLKRKLDNADNERRAVEARFEDVTRELRKTAAELTSSRASNDRLSRDTANLTMTLSELRQDNEQLSRRYQEQCQTTEAATAECTTLKRKLDAIEGDLRSTRSDLSDATAQLDSNRSENARLTLAATSLTADLRDTRNALEECRAANQRTCQERDDYARRLQEAEQLIAELRAAQPRSTAARVEPAVAQPDPVELANDADWDWDVAVDRWQVVEARADGDRTIIEFYSPNNGDPPRAGSRWTLTWAGGNAMATVTNAAAGELSFSVSIAHRNLRGALPGMGEEVTAEFK